MSTRFLMFIYTISALLTVHRSLEGAAQAFGFAVVSTMLLVIVVGMRGPWIIRNN